MLGIRLSFSGPAYFSGAKFRWPIFQGELSVSFREGNTICLTKMDPIIPSPLAALWVLLGNPNTQAIPPAGRAWHRAHALHYFHSENP